MSETNVDPPVVPPTATKTAGHTTRPDLSSYQQKYAGSTQEELVAKLAANDHKKDQMRHKRQVAAVAETTSMYKTYLAPLLNSDEITTDKNIKTLAALKSANSAGDSVYSIIDNLAKKLKESEAKSSRFETKVTKYKRKLGKESAALGDPEQKKRKLTHPFATKERRDDDIPEKMSAGGVFNGIDPLSIGANMGVARGDKEDKKYVNPFSRIFGDDDDDVDD